MREKLATLPLTQLKELAKKKGLTVNALIVQALWKL